MPHFVFLKHFNDSFEAVASWLITAAPAEHNAVMGTEGTNYLPQQMLNIYTLQYLCICIKNIIENKYSLLDFEHMYLESANVNCEVHP